jgi:hypothetical protein
MRTKGVACGFYHLFVVGHITFGDTLLVTEKPIAITTIIILLAASTFNIIQQTC